MSSDETARRTRKQMSRSLGWTLAALGILLAIVGAALSFDEVFMSDAVPLALLGTVLGVAAFTFGARRIGASAAVFSIVALVFLVAVSQGMFPGVEWTVTSPPTSRTRRGPVGLTRGLPRPVAASASHGRHSPVRLPFSAPSPQERGDVSRLTPEHAPGRGQNPGAMLGEVLSKCSNTH